MTATSTTARTPGKRRVPFWDNARWIAITLVVIGHAILKLIADSDVAYTTYLFIYLFHVPVFVSVSGYFAKSGPPGMRQLKRLLTDIVFPYFIFETIWSLINWAVRGELSLDYTTASWTLWFLIALGVWRVALPYLVMLRFPMLFAVIISVAAGYLDTVDSTLALSRTAGLLPFFVFGWKIRQWGISTRWLALRTVVIWRWRAAALCLFTAIALTLSLGIGTWRDLLIRRFLLYDEQYNSFGYDQWWAGFVRLGMLGLGMLLTAAFLTLIPRRQTFFTTWGAATMYIYLLHSFVLYPLRESGFLDHRTSPLWLVGMIVFSILVSMLLSQPFIRRIFHYVIEPDATWLFRKKALAAVPPPGAPDPPNPEGDAPPPVPSKPGTGEPAPPARQERSEEPPQPAR
jgi:fucose 4-O-acetylase-like acetyltransferase